MNTTITKDGHQLSREEYCQLKSLEAQQRFPKEEFTPEIIERMVHACEYEEETWMEESTHAQDEVMESVCADLLASEGVTAPVQAQEAVELEVVPETQWTPNSQELSMLERIRTASMESGAFTELRKKFDFSSGLKQLTPLEGVIITPFDYADALGIGYRMADAGRYLAAQAVQNLQAYGQFDNLLDQAAAMLKIGYSTLSNWTRTAQRVPIEYRDSLPFAVAQEIACAKYDRDPQKNQEAVNDLLKEAQVNGWSSEEARTNVKIKQGKPPRGTEKTQTPEYLVITPQGEYYLTDDQPGIETGMVMINLKKLERLVDDGKMASMQPIEVRK